VSQREVKYQQDVLLGLYNSEIKRTLASKEEEVIHGNILMIKILLTYSKEEVPTTNQIGLR
jgi:FKBP12-rapamycin complex-associated protein